MRPPGGAKFIAYDRLEEVEGASVEWHGGLLVVFSEVVRLAAVDEELASRLRAGHRHCVPDAPRLHRQLDQRRREQVGDPALAVQAKVDRAADAHRYLAAAPSLAGWAMRTSLAPAAPDPQGHGRPGE